jgi:DnaK suppressor protein
MATSKHTLAAPAADHDATEKLRRMLCERRRELINSIHNSMREVRAEASGKRPPTIDPGETTEVEAADDLAFTLLQMKSHVLNRINLALQRLDEGSYGYCIDCMDSIAPSRLRALPFAVRCKDCEETRERPNGVRAKRSFQHEGVVDTYVQ